MFIEPAENYLYNLDFADVAEYILPLQVGDSLPAEFLTFLGSLKGDVWVRSGTADYSLDGATVIYNGINTPDKRTCKWFKHILQVQLTDHCRLLSGVLTFHLYRNV